jgi:threonine dehydratase
MIRPITIVEAPRLAKRLGVNLTIASETFQLTGSFKFRAAYNVAASVPQNLLITASSGNFGQALACACSILKKRCIIVMPLNAAKVKIDAVKEFDGEVEIIDVRAKTRAERVRELGIQHPEAYLASSYDDPLVIQGNASIGRELAALDCNFDFIIAPVGGGGLSSGIIQGFHHTGKNGKVVGAEPLLGNDAAQSLRAGKIIRNTQEPETIADGARNLSLGEHNWAILKGGLDDIVEVPEEKIVEGVRLLFEFANVKAEPTGALGVGAVLTRPEMFQGRSVCCVVSGGNVDSAVFARLLAR